MQIQSLIKLIEDVSPCRHKRLLPNLDHTIRNGNSLVDAKYLAYNPDFYEDTQLISQLKLFDWNTELNGKKFDAVIGNPPYIRVQNMVHYSESEYQYLKSDLSGFETAKSELLDKYYLFLERGLELLAPNGRLGYIIPHKFMLIKAGGVLRKMLSEKNVLRRSFTLAQNRFLREKVPTPVFYFWRIPDTKNSILDLSISFMNITPPVRSNYRNIRWNTSAWHLGVFSLKISLCCSNKFKTVASRWMN